jgi:hypothetical protein
LSSSAATRVAVAAGAGFLAAGGAAISELTARAARAVRTSVFDRMGILLLLISSMVGDRSSEEVCRS